MLLFLAVGAGLTTWGIRLSLDPLGRNTISADVLLVLGVVSGFIGVVVACQALGWQDTVPVRITGTLMLPILFVLAVSIPQYLSADSRAVGIFPLGRHLDRDVGPVDL